MAGIAERRISRIDWSIGAWRTEVRALAHIAQGRDAAVGDGRSLHRLVDPVVAEIRERCTIVITNQEELAQAMETEGNPPDRHALRRQRAEAVAAATVESDPPSTSPDEARRMRHELRVQSVELAMLEEELRGLQAELRAAQALTAGGRAVRLESPSTETSDQRGREARLRLISQLYAASSQCSAAIVQSASEVELLPRVCRAAVTVGGMEMAWIGMIDRSSRQVMPVASFGDAHGYLANVRVSAEGDGPFARGPAGTAIRENQPYWCQDFQNDPGTAAWQADAKQAGWAAAAALPLCRDGVPVGVLVLYAGTVDAFGEEIRTLLTGMAGEISFALDGFAREAARQAGETRYHALVEWSPEPVRIHRDGIVLYVNPAAIRLFGARDADELVGKSVFDRIHPDSRERAQVRLAGTSDQAFAAPRVELRYTRMDGTSIDVEVDGVTIVFEGAPAVLASLHDISERRRAEAARQTTFRRMEYVLSNLRGGILLVSNEGGIEFANREFCDIFELVEAPHELTGLSAAAVIGKIARVYLDPAASIARITRLLAAGVTVMDEEITLQGDRIYLRDFVPIVVDGKVQGRLWFHRDVSERRAAQRMLRESQARLQGVVESAMDAIVTIDDAHQVVLFNAAAAAMLGVPGEAAIGTSIERFIPGLFRGSSGAADAVGGGAADAPAAPLPPGQPMALRANGEAFPVDASVSHVEVEGRQLYTVIMRDVSQKLLAERELQLLGAVVAASPQAILIVDAQAADRPLIFVNQAFETNTGFTKAETIGRNPRFLQGTDTTQAGLVPLRAALAAGLPIEVLLRNFRKDGSAFWNQMTIAPLRDAAGVLTHFVAVQNDVSDRQADALALAESEARFRQLAEDAPVMIWMAGADLRFEFANRALLAFTGRTMQAQAVARWFTDAHPDDVARGHAVIDTATSARMPYAWEYRRRRHDGEYRWVRANGAPRYLPGGEFAGYIGTVSDFTESRQAEQELIESAARLEQRVAERTTELTATIAELEGMTAVVSHDLRAPLHRMAGFAGLLAMEDEVKLNATALDFSSRIIRSAERMDELISKLLANARLGRTAIEVAEVSLDKAVAAYVAEVASNLGQRRVEWAIAALPVVRCDPIMLRQVVQNLIENAVKYSGKLSLARIEIGVVDNPAESGFFVRDNGVGFNMDQAGHLFGIFKRLHPEAEFPGIGIGLANVHRIMQKHGGRVWFEAAPGRGATFFVAFPKRLAAAAASAALAEAVPAAAAPPGER